MNFLKYKKLEKQLETNSFELNFGTLDKTLFPPSFCRVKLTYDETNSILATV
jgi:hypothetical protein